MLKGAAMLARPSDRRSTVPLCAVLVMLALTSSALAPEPASACSRLAETSVAGLTVLPADGTEAPSNTLVWVIDPAPAAFGDGGTSALELRHGDELLDATIEVVSIAGEQSTTLFVLRPSLPLPPGETIEVRSGATILSRFQVSDELDHTAPARPVATVEGIQGAYFGSMSCGNPSIVTLGLAEAVTLAFVVDADAAGAALPSTVLGAASGSTARVVALPSGTQRVRIVAFDLAGNASEPSDEIALNVPARASGCSAGADGTSTGAASTLLLLAWVGVRARRARRGQGA